MGRGVDLSVAARSFAPSRLDVSAAACNSRTAVLTFRPLCCWFSSHSKRSCSVSLRVSSATRLSPSVR